MQHLDEGTIHAWIDGALSPTEARDVESHLGVCEECAHAAAEARGLVAASSRILTALDDVPGGVVPIVPSTASAPPASPGVTPIRDSAVRRRWPTPFWMRTAAAVVVIAGTSALIMTGKLNNMRPSDTAALAVDSRAPEMALPAEAAASAEQTVANAPAVAAAPDSFSRLPSPVSPPRSGAGASGTGGRLASAPLAAAPTKGSAFGGPVSRDGAQSRVASAAATSAAAQAPQPGRPGSRVEQSSVIADERALADRAITSREEAQRQRSAVDAQAGKVTGDLALQRSSAPPAAAAAPAIREELHTDTGRITRAPPGITGMIRSGVSKVTRGEGTASRPSGTFSADREWLSSSGCYALTLSPWTGGSIPFGSPPPKIELDTLRNELGELLVHPGRGAASNGARAAHWTQQGDSVYITWREGTRGVTVTLPATGTVRRGRAVTIPDGGSVQTSAVEARRISCRE